MQQVMPAKLDGKFEHRYEQTCDVLVLSSASFDGPVINSLALCRLLETLSLASCAAFWKSSLSSSEFLSLATLLGVCFSRFTLVTPSDDMMIR